MERGLPKSIAPPFGGVAKRRGLDLFGPSGARSLVLPATGRQTTLQASSLGAGGLESLDLSASGAAAPGTVTRDAAGFAFSPDGRFLYYRAGCAPAGDGCALFRLPTGGPGPSQSPERLADGVASFAVAPASADRMLLAFARRDGAGVDLSAWVGGRLVPLDGKVLPGSAVLLPPDGKRAAWIGTAPERRGVFVAHLP